MGDFTPDFVAVIFMSAGSLFGPSIEFETNGITPLSAMRALARNISPSEKDTSPCMVRLSGTVARKISRCSTGNDFCGKFSTNLRDSSPVSSSRRLSSILIRHHANNLLNLAIYTNPVANA